MPRSHWASREAASPCVCLRLFYQRKASQPDSLACSPGRKTTNPGFEGPLPSTHSILHQQRWVPPPPQRPPSTHVCQRLVLLRGRSSPHHPPHRLRRLASPRPKPGTSSGPEEPQIRRPWVQAPDPSLLLQWRWRWRCARCCQPAELLPPLSLRQGLQVLELEQQQQKVRPSSGLGDASLLHGSVDPPPLVWLPLVEAVR
mmetsp:Transcript_41601/g.89311  ORF Transcript_41601/g.89311 Transcript_41601/m.89311 type:complete len:200 (+) Transcript_41601:2045-2644(+)